jgi:X-Pro dipeptidyl-peptidase
MGEDMDVLYQFVQSGDPARRAWADENILKGELLAGIDRQTGDWNEFWKARDYWHQLDRIKVPTLLAHGLSDWNVMPSHSTHVYTELRKRGVPAQLYLHQGGHGGDPPFEALNRWFTRWLYEVENGVENDAPCTIVREGGSRSSPTAYADWPNPDAKPVVLQPQAGGGETGMLVVADPAAAPASVRETIVDDVAKSGASLARLFPIPAPTARRRISSTMSRRQAPRSRRPRSPSIACSTRCPSSPRRSMSRERRSCARASRATSPRRTSPSGSCRCHGRAAAASTGIS